MLELKINITIKLLIKMAIEGIYNQYHKFN
jgi:hypothetical protein